VSKGKDISTIVKYGAIAGGIALVGYIAYKVIKGLGVIPEVFGDIQESLVKDIGEYEELPDFQNDIAIHGPCISYTTEYKGAWALFGLGTITREHPTKASLIDLLDATQSAFPQENKVNMCYMNLKDGYRVFIGTGNQILNYQAELPLTEIEQTEDIFSEYKDEPIFSIQPVSPIERLAEPIVLVSGEEYIPVSPAITQEIYEENLQAIAERKILEEQKEIEREIFVETYEQYHPEVPISEIEKISYERERMENLEPIFTIQPVLPEPIIQPAPTTYEEYRSQKLEYL